MICKQCWKKTNDFHLFYCEVESNQSNLQQHPILDVVLDDFNVLNKNDIKYETTATIDDCEVDTVKESIYDVVKVESFSDDWDYENKSIIEDTEKNVEENPLTKEKVKRTKTTNKNLENLSVESPNSKNVKRKRFLINSSEQQNLLQFFKMQCDLCDRKFKSWNDAKNHYREQHEIKGYLVCYCCNEKFNILFRILDHIAYCINPEAFK
jgi:hypothetical protein